MTLTTQHEEEILKDRQKYLGRNLSLSYEDNHPLIMMKGERQYMYDSNGKRYLDCVNNVAHVGHCHPKVVKAASEQLGELNTNTRYLHPMVSSYAKKLVATMPESLQVCYLVCSGTEANELALRLARTHTNKTGVLVMDHAYHGNSTSMVQISPYKYQGQGGFVSMDYVHQLSVPDSFRCRGYNAAEHAASMKTTIEKAKTYFGKPIGAFFAESLMGCAGQIVFPDGYLKQAYQIAKDAGIVCIADEVQVGFGRVGTHFWGFETQSIIPDIVTLGKPIGNGFPMAAVITTTEIASSFCNGMEYFNTFGGSTVACAVGSAVLDVIFEENLQHNALYVGGVLKEGLVKLKEKHKLIGDVRGCGLFLGVELVRDHITLEPAKKEAHLIVNQLKNQGILLSCDGPYHNVLKIKPPLCITVEDVQQLLNALDTILYSIT